MNERPRIRTVDIFLTCHHCGHLHPLEAVTCTNCGLYIARAHAHMHGTLTPPPAVDPLDPRTPLKPPSTPP